MIDSLTSEVWAIGPAEVLVRRCLIAGSAAGSDIAFLKALSRRCLTDIELQAWEAMSANSSRQLEWLHGRLVLKDVVRSWAFELGHIIEPAEVEIRVDPAGAPYVRSAALAVMGGPPVVSLSHTTDLVIAGAADPGSLLGIDVEHADRSVEMVARALSSHESQLVAGGEASVLDLLVAKEAATKALGVGLGGGISRWPVAAVSIVDEGLLVQVSSSSDTGLDLSVLIIHSSGTVVGICYSPDDSDAA